MSNHTPHVVPIKTYAMNFAALLVLMALTVLAAQIHVPVPGLGEHNSLGNNLMAMAIACLKAFLVIWIFMGAMHSTRVTKMFIFGGFLWFLLLFVTYCDYLTRPFEAVQGWTKEIPSGFPAGQNPYHFDLK